MVQNKRNFRISFWGSFWTWIMRWATRVNCSTAVIRLDSAAKVASSYNKISSLSCESVAATQWPTLIIYAITRRRRFPAAFYRLLLSHHPHSRRIKDGDPKCLEQIFQSICMDCSFSSALSVYSLYFHWLKTWAVLWMQTGRSWSSRTHGRKEVAREIKIFTKAALPAGRQGQRQ